MWLSLLGFIVAIGVFIFGVSRQYNFVLMSLIGSLIVAFTDQMDVMDEVAANARKVLDAGRKAGVPIFHSTTGYWGEEQWDLNRWDEKIPMSELELETEWMDIDPKLDPQPEEPVFVKKYASNFFGTNLAQTLTFLGVDTLIVMGATATACVPHTVMDSTGYGFKTLIPEGTIGDRVPGVVEWNMFDMEAKFADVLSVDEVVEYLEGIDNSVYTKHERKQDAQKV